MSCTTDVYFLRQLAVLLAFCFHSIGSGIMLAFPSVLNPAIISSNGTDITVTSHQASWIAAIHGFSGFIGFIIVPPLMQVLGRRITKVFLNVMVLLGFLIFTLAESVIALYIARTIQGISICTVFIAPIIVAEYVHPKRRGYFVTLKKISIVIGSLLCHVTSLWWTWRQIAAFGIVPCVISLVLTFVYPESPAFLAMSGKYEECNKAHIWLHGESVNSRRDIEELISKQKERRNADKNFKNKMAIIKTKFKKMFKRDFVKPFIIVSLLTVIIDASGRVYMMAYIVQILKETTGDKLVALYCTIGADMLALTALSISCFTIRRFNRRAILFTSSIISIGLMLLISLLMYLKSYTNNISIINWLSPAVILLNIFLVNIGVIPTSFAVIGEIFPLEHKGPGLCVSGVVFTVLYILVMKFTPVMIEETGVEGTFAIFALCIVISLVILYFILNETKDKTLQEIENQIRGIEKPGLIKTLIPTVE